MSAEEKKTRQMPKGGRKGGTIFPRIALQDAVGYARRLVSKTHTSRQPRDVIYSGVVGAKAGIGDVRISALKQYGFLDGDAKSGYTADELAKKIVAAPPEELPHLYGQAVLKPTVFKRLFDTFQSDTVTRAKLKQRAADLKVHPDETDTCVELYVASLATAGLVSVDGDRITHLASADMSETAAISVVTDENNQSLSNNSTVNSPATRIDAGSDTEAAASDIGEEDKNGFPVPPGNSAQPAPRANFNVNVTLDSSMDIEKLQKQLELLKRFGAI
ncbi:hypothetical protein SAZ10_28300 [Mesorhizobium sp. BAC0120]|uniref:hypothetical protein n=1 Tax=Mesorhizobium sp. BAC0120 TaxID=3090670 RepID=UPI00298C1387|nr:hypothetical protein [Mesorhizobium sp. BAC0120]MDW6025671.1 hypothetical protein [Mesorhizobium sp. BAC0120]